MTNVIDFPSDDFSYITEKKENGSIQIVGVECKDISILLADDMENIMLGDFEIRREELIAFIYACGIWEDLEQEWIGVDDCLPEIIDSIGSSEAVLLYRPMAPESNDPVVCLGVYHPKHKKTSPQGVEHCFDCWCHPTHWMKIPKLPA